MTSQAAPSATTATRLVKAAIKHFTASDDTPPPPTATTGDAAASTVADVPPSLLKPLKQFARGGDAHTSLIAEEVLLQLAHKRDCRARYGALELCAVLWPRSALFRRALHERLVPDFVQLVGGGAGAGSEIRRHGGGGGGAVGNRSSSTRRPSST